MERLIAHYLTQINISGEDADILHNKVQNVNTRLLNSNSNYREIIEEIIKFMTKMLETKFDDYSTLKGMSGANVGIPLNIIAIKATTDKGLPKSPIKHIFPKIISFINPIITRHSKKFTIVQSNCGSVNLTEPIKISRYDWIDVEYFTLEGLRKLERYEKPMSFTIQHEVDHNHGVVITDKIFRREENVKDTGDNQEVQKHRNSQLLSDE